MATENPYYKKLLKVKSRNSVPKLKHPFRKIHTGQKILSYIRPSLWNNLSETIRKNE